MAHQAVRRVKFTWQSRALSSRIICNLMSVSLFKGLHSSIVHQRMINDVLEYLPRNFARRYYGAAEGEWHFAASSPHVSCDSSITYWNCSVMMPSPRLNLCEINDI
eukprot:scaffold439945_cov28-Prasinocladus_malaysianus.AAC.1